MAALFTTEIPELTLLARGKVRDVYDLGDMLAIVATDRISCFDVVLPTPVPDKGRILTRMSAFWLRALGTTIPRHHLLTADTAAMPKPLASRRELEGRTMLVRKHDVFPVECIVRGYLAGSAVAEYQKSGTVCGIPLPAGLKPFARLPAPIFTPSTKAAAGAKDENITYAQMAKTVGERWAAKLRDQSLAVYAKAHELALACGIIIADTKLEWGRDGDELVLVDEVLTPDSSRFWPVEGWREGEGADSYDKQYVRDWLVASGWDKRPPAPALPPEVVARTSALYARALAQLTGDTSMLKAPVAIAMGSDSDFDAITDGLRLLDGFGIQYSLAVVSAHRSPDEAAEFARNAKRHGVKVIIAIAGKAAHLAGVLAAHTTLPVLGVPAAGGSLGGLDALLSTAQMPGGVPVGTLGIGAAGGTNAALLAARIIGLSEERVAARLEQHKERMRTETLAKSEGLADKVRAARSAAK